MESAQLVSNIITLRGSTDIVTEFFDYSINSILYQRGIYPPESFHRISKYGLAMMKTIEEGLQKYIANILTQLQGIESNLSYIDIFLRNPHRYSLAFNWKCEEIGSRSQKR